MKTVSCSNARRRSPGTAVRLGMIACLSWAFVAAAAITTIPTVQDNQRINVVSVNGKKLLFIPAGGFGTERLFFIYWDGSGWQSASTNPPPDTSASAVVATENTDRVYYLTANGQALVFGRIEETEVNHWSVRTNSVLPAPLGTVIRYVKAIAPDVDASVVETWDTTAYRLHLLRTNTAAVDLGESRYSSPNFSSTASPAWTTNGILIARYFPSGIEVFVHDPVTGDLLRQTHLSPPPPWFGPYFIDGTGLWYAQEQTVHHLASALLTNDVTLNTLLDTNSSSGLVSLWDRSILLYNGDRSSRFNPQGELIFSVHETGPWPVLSLLSPDGRFLYGGDLILYAQTGRPAFDLSRVLNQQPVVGYRMVEVSGSEVLSLARANYWSDDVYLLPIPYMAIRATKEGLALRLSWPATDALFQLQSSVLPSGPYQDDGSTPTITNGTVSVFVAPDDAHRFFWLEQR